MLRFAKPMTLMFLALLAGGCGFHLRGAAPVPPALQPLWVNCESGVPSGLCEALKTQLRVGVVKLANSREEADHHLMLGGFRQQQRTSAISARAEAAEYDLRQSVSMAVLTSDGIPLLEATEVSASLSYRFDSTSVLAKRRERREIESRLYDNLARQISFRLSPFDGQRIEKIRQAHDAAGSNPAQP